MSIDVVKTGTLAISKSRSFDQIGMSKCMARAKSLASSGSRSRRRDCASGIESMYRTSETALTFSAPRAS